MAFGAVKAVEEAGSLKVAVFKNFRLQAYTAVEAAAAFLDSQKLENRWRDSFELFSIAY